jgi:hypothetical protein
VELVLFLLCHGRITRYCAGLEVHNELTGPSGIAGSNPAHGAFSQTLLKRFFFLQEMRPSILLLLLLTLALLVLLVGCNPTDVASERADGKAADLVPRDMKCTTNQVTGKQNVCSCEDDGREGFMFILKKGGIYDVPAIHGALDLYGAAVGDTVYVLPPLLVERTDIDGLRAVITQTYAETSLAYGIIIGDDLPLIYPDEEEEVQNVHEIHEMLEHPVTPFVPNGCKDIILSLVPPPLGYSNDEKVAFVRDVIVGFARRQYAEGVLVVYDESIAGPVDGVESISNSDMEGVQAALREQPAVLVLNVHGSSRQIGLWGATSLSDYAVFAREHGSPLIVDSAACNAVTVFDKTSLGAMQKGADDFCCWPQAFLAAGTRAYYIINGGTDITVNKKVYAQLEDGRMLGEILRELPHTQQYVYGDVLARVG